MRKLLLASAAVLGATGVAQAQTMVTTPVPNVPGANAPAQGGNSGGTSTPAGLAPGQIQVRLNGRFNWYAGFVQDGNTNAAYWTNSATGQGISTGAVPQSSSWFAKATSGAFSYSLRPGGPLFSGYSISGANSIAVRAKTNQGFQLSSYIRLYPGFDGMAANGLRYGVSAEIRQDVGASTTPGQVNGASGGGAAGSISAQNQKRSFLYWRRAYGYIAGDSWGTLRFGSGDGPSGLYMTGNFENFNDSGWNGDLPAQFVNAPAWPFADVGSVYTTNKIVYLSPAWAGFEVGASYAPTSNALSNSSGCILGMASVGCDRLFSIDANGNTKEQLRQHDFFEAMARYRGTFSGVGLSFYGGWFGSSSITTNNTLTQQYGGSLPQTTYSNNSIGVGGGQISYAGFTVGGMVQSGSYNRGQGFAPAPKGAGDATAWLVGGSYTTGPIIVGASYFDFVSPGSYVPLGTASQTAASNGTQGVGKQQTERGFAAGATYAVAPGFSLFLSYLWGDRQQDGVNLLTGQTGCSIDSSHAKFGQSGCYKNMITVQAISLGTQLRW